ncbi:hypothetical protein OSB04_024214 [Centaurea solstitialis]|uniref:Uncharacterized protein n=1 Tax=Centaurea solstitialis TaxID=347529 RepID=A0AA38W0E7_9ASTR|nr:hypothetical protein OSB04_024214 [Centaurea solstitialis]
MTSKFWLERFIRGSTSLQVQSHRASGIDDRGSATSTSMKVDFILSSRIFPVTCLACAVGYSPTFIQGLGLCLGLIDPTTSDKINQVRERLKTARDRQKNYADKRRKDIEFEVGDHVMLKVGVTGGVDRRTQHVPCVKLKEVFGGIRDGDTASIEVDHKLSFVEEPVTILYHRIRNLKNKDINLVKVQWRFHKGQEVTCETESEMRAKRGRGGDLGKIFIKQLHCEQRIPRDRTSLRSGVVWGTNSVRHSLIEHLGEPATRSDALKNVIYDIDGKDDIAGLDMEDINRRAEAFINLSKIKYGRPLHIKQKAKYRS